MYAFLFGKKNNHSSLLFKINNLRVTFVTFIKKYLLTCTHFTNYLDSLCYKHIYVLKHTIINMKQVKINANLYKYVSLILL